MNDMKVITKKIIQQDHHPDHWCGIRMSEVI